MSKAEARYREALERLKNNKPEVLTKGAYTINNDTVAQEAGKETRGAIKKSRFKGLVDDIKEAEKGRLAAQGITPPKESEVKARKHKTALEELKDKYEAALNREVNLVIALRKVTKENAELKANAKVITIKRD